MEIRQDTTKTPFQTVSQWCPASVPKMSHKCSHGTLRVPNNENQSSLNSGYTTVFCGKKKGGKVRMDWSENRRTKKITHKILLFNIIALHLSIECGACYSQELGSLCLVAACLLEGFDDLLVFGQNLQTC